MREGMKWYCNAHPDRAEVVEGCGVALHHIDSTELIMGGELGEFQADGEEMRLACEAEGIVGIYVPENWP